MGRVIDMLNYGSPYFKVLSYKGISEENRGLWECKCICGNIFVKEGKYLRNQKYPSCGCINKARLRELSKTSSKTHGDNNTHLHGIWIGIRKRCKPSNSNNKRYKYYAGKGIKVCEEWENNYLSFKAWSIQNGYAQNLTLDRINPDGDYSPENCRWVSMKEQQNNRGNTVYIKYNGEFIARGDLATLLNTSVQTINFRSKSKHTKHLYERYKKVNGIFIKET